MTYEPMANNRAEFDPMGAEWAYIVDDNQIIYHHPLTAPRLREGWWPFARKDTEYADAFVRLSPDWCLYSWGSEYVLAGRGEQPHLAVASLHVGDCGHYCEVHLDLRAGNWTLAWAYGVEVTPELLAEAGHKAGKLLAYLTAECARRDKAGSTRPVTAHDLHRGA